MPMTLNTKAYSLDTYVNADKVRYTGPAHTALIEDTISLGRGKRAPVVDKHNGYSLATVTVERTFTCADGVKRVGSINVSVSYPSDAVAADVDSMREDLGDLLIASYGQDLVNKHDLIN